MIFEEFKESLYINKDDYLNYLNNVKTCSNKYISEQISELIEAIINDNYVQKVRYNNQTQTVQFIYKGNSLQFYPDCIISNYDDLKELLKFIELLIDIPDRKGLAYNVATIYPSKVCSEIFEYFNSTYNLDTIKDTCNIINKVCGCLMVKHRFSDIEVREAVNAIYNNCIITKADSTISSTLSKFLNTYDNSNSKYDFYKYKKVNTYDKALTYLEDILLPDKRLLYTTTISNANNSKGFSLVIARVIKDFVRGITYDKHETKLSPSPTLLYSIKSGSIDWEEYTTTLLKELETINAFGLLYEYIRYHGEVTIMCYCSKLKRCHRQIIAKVMRDKYGVESIEL